MARERMQEKSEHFVILEPKVCVCVGGGGGGA